MFSTVLGNWMLMIESAAIPSCADHIAVITRSTSAKVSLRASPSVKVARPAGSASARLSWPAPRSAPENLIERRGHFRQLWRKRFHRATSPRIIAASPTKCRPFPANSRTVRSAPMLHDNRDGTPLAPADKTAGTTQQLQTSTSSARTASTKSSCPRARNKSFPSWRRRHQAMLM